MPRRGDRITASELRDDDTGATLEETLRRMRPDFMRGVAARGVLPLRVVEPSVFLDGEFVGGIAALRTIPRAAVIELQLLRVSAAHDRFGAYCECDGGVVLVVTRRPR